MRNVFYVTRFTGQAMRIGTVGGLFRITATAPDIALNTLPGGRDIVRSLQEVAGKAATLEVEITCTSTTTFQGIGRITLGEGLVFHFSSMGSGYLPEHEGTDLQQGAVIWLLDRESAPFGNVRGIITSNFVVGRHLAITDYQVGVLLLP